MPFNFLNCLGFSIAMSLRIRAFLIHLAASVILALVAMVIVFVIWYPSPLARAIGVTDVFLIVLGVDVVIGPLLTFVVYRTGKRSLHFDLATIVCLQLAAFAYGFWTVAEGRPAWLVFNDDHFDLVQVYQIDRRKLDEALPEFRHLPYFGPGWATATYGDTPEERKSALSDALIAGVFVTERPEFYRSLAVASYQIREKAKPLADLKRANAPTNVDAILEKWPEADAFLPMVARAHSVTVLINKASTRVVAVVDLNPLK